jgi:RNA recognition motif-containing protein
MGKDKKEKSKSPKKSVDKKSSPKRTSEQQTKKVSKNVVDHSASKESNDHDDSNASMSVETKSPRKQSTEVIQVSNEEFNEIAEEKLAQAEATVKRVRGNVKKRKYREKSLPEPLVSAPVEGSRLFIGNVSPVATKEDVAAFFAPIGKVVDYQVIVHTNKDLSTRPNAFSFVTMESVEVANQAIASLNGKAMTKYPSHKVIVKQATPKANKNKKNKTTHGELPKKLEKKVEKKVEKVEKKLDQAEKKIEKADKKVEKVEKKIEKGVDVEKVEKAEKKVEKAMAKVDKAVHKAEKAESKVEKQYQKADKRARK